MSYTYYGRNMDFDYYGVSDMGNFLLLICLLKSAGPLNLQSGRAAHESNCPTFFFPSLLHLSPFAVPFGPVAIAAGCPATRPLAPVLTSQVDERLLRSATNLKSCGLCHFHRIHRCLRSHRCCHNYHHSHRLPAQPSRLLPQPSPPPPSLP